MGFKHLHIIHSHCQKSHVFYLHRKGREDQWPVQSPAQKPPLLSQEAPKLKLISFLPDWLLLMGFEKATMKSDKHSREIFRSDLGSNSLNTASCLDTLQRQQFSICTLFTVEGFSMIARRLSYLSFSFFRWKSKLCTISEHTEKLPIIRANALFRC